MVRLNQTLLVLLVSTLVACGALQPGSKGSLPKPSQQPGDSMDQLPETHGDSLDENQSDDILDADEPSGLSLQSKLRIKDGSRIARDLEAALELPRDSLCKELGELSCLDSVHKISLGGVDPYEKSIFEGRKDIGLSTPLVLERIVLSACGKRVEMDLAGESVIFSNIANLDNRGKAVNTLYERAFLRSATTEEQNNMASAFSDFDGKSWALASCFAVLSSSEFLFY